MTAFRQLATHTAQSVDKGDRIIVVGKLRITEWESVERTGTNVEIEAEALGHDLAWCMAAPTRSVGAVAPVEAQETGEEIEEGTA